MNTRVPNEKKLRKMHGLDRDENGRVWMDIILDVWLATFGIETQIQKEGN